MANLQLLKLKAVVSWVFRRSTRSNCLDLPQDERLTETRALRVVSDADRSISSRSPTLGSTNDSSEAEHAAGLTSKRSQEQSTVASSPTSANGVSVPAGVDNKALRDLKMKRLAIAYIMEENKDLKNALLIISKLTIVDISTVTKFTEKCGAFIFQFAEVYDNVLPASEATITELLRSLRDLDNTLFNPRFDDQEEERKHSIDTILSTLTERLQALKDFYPLINNVHDGRRRHNTTQAELDSVLDTAATLLDMIRDGCDLIPPPFIKPAVNLAYGLLRAVRKTRTNYEDMQDISGIASEFILSIALFCDEHSIRLTTGIEAALARFTNVLKDIVEQCIQLADTSLISRFLQQGRDSDTLMKLKATLQQAIKEFQVKTQILQHSDFHGFARVVNDKLDGDVIKNLPENPFFEGTRDDFIPEIQDDVLNQIATWIESSSSPIFWLCGGAGFGKSSISHQLVYHLIDTRRLAAQMFFTRGSAMQKNIVTVIQTLAHELASMHPKTVPDIAKTAREGGSNHQELSSYLKRYIFGPIQALGLPRSMVIVLDALDECENHHLLLKAFADISDFSGVKIFITSRPEHSISNAIHDMHVEKVALKRLSPVKMEKYFSVRFDNMDWPDDQRPSRANISEMAALADGLLIWAATSCKFIENDLQDDEPYQLLQNIISAGKARDIASDDQLASLYRTALAHLFQPKHIQSFLAVFQAMLVFQVPMTVENFAKAFSLGIRPTRAVHSALFALQIYEEPNKEIILPAAQRFHSSFLEYVTNDHLHTPSDQFYINLSDAHSTIAQKCLSRLPDISSWIQSSQVPKHDSLACYAPGYWPFHLTQSVKALNLPPHEAQQALNRFAHDGMPVWIPFYPIISRSLDESLEGPGSSNTIDLAISFHTHSVELFAATGTTQTADALSDHGFALWKRYDQSGFYKDLEDSIALHSRFLDSHSSPSLQRAKALSRLAIALRAHHNTVHSSNADLDNTIAALTEATELFSMRDVQGYIGTDKYDTRYFQTLSTLASTLRMRFEETGITKDLDEAIAMQTRAVEMMSLANDTAGHARASNGLATGLFSRFEETFDANDLNRAISILESILQGRPPGHPLRPSTLNNLAFGRQRRYDQYGHIEDLDNALAMHAEVLESRPAPHQFRAQTLTNIAQCLRFRFENAGSFETIEEAISKDTEALELRPSSHPYHYLTLDRLGMDFYSRFLLTSNTKDLAVAVANFQQAASLCPESHREHFYYISNFGKALRSRSQVTGDMKDLDDAVALQRQSISKCPSGTQLSTVLHDLAATLLAQYEQTKSPEILSEAINYYRQSLKLRLGSHPRRFESLTDLAKALHYQSNQSNMLNDLDEAIGLYNEALGLYGTTYPCRPIAAAGLAQAWYSRFELNHSFDDLEISISLYEGLLATTQSFSVIGGRDSAENGLATALIELKSKA